MKLSKAATAMEDDTQPDRRLYEADCPGLSMDGVLSWFGLQLSPAKRVELMYGLLHMCQPLEVRFLGACLDALVHRDFHFLREFDVNTNSRSRYSQQRLLGDVSDPVVWSQLLVSLALLSSDNRDGAGELQQALSHIDPVSLLQTSGLNYADRSRPGGHDALSRGGSVEDTLELLFTMASLHPALSFHHREVAKFKRSKLEQMMKRRDYNQRMPGGDQVKDSAPSHQTVTVPPHVSQPPSPQDTQKKEAVVPIDLLVMMRVAWNRPNWEYTIEVHWSDSTQTTVTKTHHQLESFVSELPCEHQVYRKDLLSVLQQADQYEPWELKNKLRELLQRAPKAFRECEQICSYFLPHSQSESFKKAQEQPPLKPMSQRCKAATLLTAGERWDDGLPNAGRGRILNMEGLEKQRHPFGFSSTISDLLQKMERSRKKTEDQAKEEQSSCTLATSNPAVHVLGPAILQATPTPTPQPTLSPTVQPALTPELSHEQTLSSLVSSPMSSSSSTHSLSLWSALDRSPTPQPSCSPSEGYQCDGEGPEEQNNNQFLSHQNWKSEESVHQKITQAQPLLQSQDVKKFPSSKNMTQKQQQFHNQSLVEAQAPSLLHSESQEAVPQLHVIQTQAHVQDNLPKASKDHKATESEVQQDQAEASPKDMEPLIQALPCTVHTETHSCPNDQVSQVPHNPTESLSITVDHLAGRTQNVSIAKHQDKQNPIQSSICTDTPAKTPMDSVTTEPNPSFDLHASGSYRTSTSVTAISPFSLFSTSSFGRSLILANVKSLGKTAIAAGNPTLSHTTVEAPKTSLSQTSIPAPNSALSQASALSPPSSLNQATASVPISTVDSTNAPTTTSLSSSNSPALAQAAGSRYAQAKATYPTVLAPSPDRFKLQHSALISPFISVISPSLSQSSGLGLEPISGTRVKQAGSAGTLSCNNCGKSGCSGECCLEPSEDSCKQVAE